MTLLKNKLYNINKKNNIELFNCLLKQISIDYKIPYEELQDKYIKQITLSKEKKNKGKQTCYSIFLKDNEIKEYVEKTHGKNLSFSEKSKIYSNIWKVMSKKDKEKYKNKAIINNNLLDSKKVIGNDIGQNKEIINKDMENKK